MPGEVVSSEGSSVGSWSRSWVAALVHERRVGLVFLVCGATLVVSWMAVSWPNDLQQVELIRIREFHNLRRNVGEQIWPGWGRIETPVLLVKPDTEYLFDHPRPPEGFRELAGVAHVGRVFRRRGHLVPQFATCALPIRGIPTVIIPDKRSFDQLGRLAAAGELVVGRFDRGNDTATYLLMCMHEAFHAYQETAGLDKLLERLRIDGEASPDPAATPPALNADDSAQWARLALLNDRDIQDRLAEAEAQVRVMRLLEDECRNLAAALAAADEPACRREIRKFLAARQARRQATVAASAGLTVEQVIDFEQSLEWVEGMARYTEGRLCATLKSGPYKPTLDLSNDRDFKGYDQIEPVDDTPVAQAHERAPRPRSYVVGAALCRLLDRLDPGWKGKALHEGRPLEQLVADASTP